MCDASLWLLGKVIVKQEDHILWVESLVLRNLGPISRFHYHTGRRFIGRFFCWLGNSIYSFLVFFSAVVSGCKSFVKCKFAITYTEWGCMWCCLIAWMMLNPQGLLQVCMHGLSTVVA